MVVTMVESGEWRQSGAWGGARGRVGGDGGLIRWPLLVFETDSYSARAPGAVKVLGK